MKRIWLLTSRLRGHTNMAVFGTKKEALSEAEAWMQHGDKNVKVRAFVPQSSEGQKGT